MNTRLEDLKGEQPDSPDSDPDQETLSSEDDGFEEGLDKLLQEESDTKEEADPAGDQQEDEPDEEAGDPEDENPEEKPDAAEDAGQAGEEEKPAETPPAFDRLQGIDDTVLTAAAQEHEQAIERGKQNALRNHSPKYQQIQGQKQQIAGKVLELKQRYTTEEGETLPMSMQDTALLNDLMAQAREILKDEQDISSRYNQDIAASTAEATIQGNLKIYPQLKKFENEYRTLAGAGFDCSDAGMVYAACQALRLQNGGELQAPPAAPAVSKADVEKAALKDNLDRKRKGAVIAGSKSAGLKPGVQPRVPKALQADMDEITSHFNGGDE